MNAEVLSDTAIIDLTELAQQINDKIKSADELAAKAVMEYEDTCKKSILEAKEVGELLVRARENVKHGEWTTWVKENIQKSIRQVQKYMQLYLNWEEIQAKALPNFFEGAFNLNKTLELLTIGTEEAFDESEGKEARAENQEQEEETQVTPTDARSLVDNSKTKNPNGGNKSKFHKQRNEHPKPEEIKKSPNSWVDCYEKSQKTLIMVADFFTVIEEEGNYNRITELLESFKAHERIISNLRRRAEEILENYLENELMADEFKKSLNKAKAFMAVEPLEII